MEDLKMLAFQTASIAYRGKVCFVKHKESGILHIDTKPTTTITTTITYVHSSILCIMRVGLGNVIYTTCNESLQYELAHRKH